MTQYSFQSLITPFLFFSYLNVIIAAIKTTTSKRNVLDDVIGTDKELQKLKGMLQKVTEYAKGKHKSVNHNYGLKDYSYHLNMVCDVAKQFIHLVDEDQRENVYCGCWVHDIIEDARETYNDVLQNTNETIANLAYALTNEKGKNRNERASDKYYKEMHEVPNAVFIKMCDRIANITHSKNEGSKMFDKYKKENDNFIKKLYRPELQEMITFIDKLLA